MDKKEDLTFRSLEIEDAFLILDIVDALGIEEFKECFTNKDVVKQVKNLNKVDENDENNESGTLKVGYEVALKCVTKVIKNIKRCKNEIYTLIAALTEREIKDVAKLSLWKVSGCLLKLTQDEEFRDFLEVASSLRK